MNLTTSLDGFADDREGESAPWNDLGCPLGLGLDVVDNREARRPRHPPRRPMLLIRLRQKLFRGEIPYKQHGRWYKIKLWHLLGL